MVAIATKNRRRSERCEPGGQQSSIGACHRTEDKLHTLSQDYSLLVLIMDLKPALDMHIGY
eukprot:SAG31_NODE_337_length_17493_cov_5.855755_4_plen_61_part_00